MHTPLHVAVIMDGNGRWAKQKGLPRQLGHRAAASRVRELIRVAIAQKIRVLTLYAFSTENWSRPSEEVDFLMGLYLHYFRQEMKTWHRQGVKVRLLGNRQGLNPALQEIIAKGEQLTAHNTALELNIALNYGGRSEILQAVHSIVSEVQSGHLDSKALNESRLGHYLNTVDQPDPELLIRTGGVQRLSNFLIWQGAYAELYFTDIYFPDFDRHEFQKALTWFSQQTRRFGKTDEQLEVLNG